MEGRTDDPTILVTGFEAFGDSEKNPTAEIIRLLDGTSIADHRVAGVALPVTVAGAPEALREAVALYNPSLVLSLGLANGRSMLALERIAINVLDFPIPDNDGSQPAGEPVVEGGPAAYFATLPIKAILVAWREAGLPGYVSNTAGTYVCNQTFYHSLHLSDLRRAFAARACKEYLWARRRAKASLESAGGRLQRLALASRSSSESERTKIGGFMRTTISHNQKPALNVH